MADIRVWQACPGLDDANTEHEEFAFGDGHGGTEIGTKRMGSGKKPWTWGPYSALLRELGLGLVDQPAACRELRRAVLLKHFSSLMFTPWKTCAVVS